MQVTKHGWAIAGGGEYTLCGRAFDAHESGDEEEPVLMAEPDKLVTCKECRRAIDHARAFKNYRTPKE